MTTTWKPIPGYEGHYSVSDTGLVRSEDRKIDTKDGSSVLYMGRLLKPELAKDGRLKITLCRGNASKHYLVHRLVALTFHPNPEYKPQVNHIDSDPQNNHVDNLEWVTASENTQHCINQGRYVCSNSTSNEKIKQIKDLLDRGHSRRDIVRLLRVDNRTISKFFGKI